MLESLRAQLLLWYALILSALIVLYAGAVTYVYWRSLLGDVDARLAVAAGTVAQSLTRDESGTFDLNLPPQFRQTEFADRSTAYYAVWNQRGDLVDRSDPDVSIPSYPQIGASTRDGRRELAIDAPGPARVLVGRSLEAIDAQVRALAVTVTAAGGLVLLVSLAGGWFLAGRALAPVARISRTAGAMVGGDLGARIPVQDTESELEQLARALNEAFDRMRLAADLQRQFTADASHELRTPLATLRAEFEWVLGKPRSETEYRAAIDKARQAVERLTEVADRLLTLARGDDLALHARRGTVDVSTVLADLVSVLSPLAQAHGVRVETDLAPAHTVGDPSLLADAFSNLLKNAIEYNGPRGLVLVRASADHDGVSVRVRDTGVGIAPEDLPRIFDRFYRADRSRTRHVGGAGLGLAIVKKTIEAHGGSITCASTPGIGTEFTVRLPLAPAAAASAPPRAATA
ncbi:MAG: HAMP domain-containing protein [Acidobacteria bacterium]|nr:HAMP domain-containing protein [Acidobacteriota bacterium]